MGPLEHINELTEKCGEWLRGTGPDSDIVMSSRVRLARNLAGFPFVRQCTPTDKTNVEAFVHERLPRIETLGTTFYVDVNELESLDRRFLVERQLISRELADAEGARSVAIDQNENYSLMINEEDHLRMQVMKSGLDLHAAWRVASELDDWIESRVSYAFHHKLGYLTACPTNVGTGVRVSVMLHLPALVITQQIEKVFRSLNKISLAVRGLFGEGSQAMGDFYQISNQITLGRSETELIDQVSDVVPMVIDYERRARDFLLRESSTDLEERVSSAYGVLRNAQTISSEETMHLLSSLRMGINMNFIDNIDLETLNKLFIHTQPAHLQKINGGELPTAERNSERAQYIRQLLGGNDELS